MITDSDTLEWDMLKQMALFFFVIMFIVGLYNSRLTLGTGGEKVEK